MYTCPNCNWKGKPVKETPGSFVIELLLWMLFILPGLLYSLWRLGSRKKVCANCHFPHIYKIYA